MLLAPLEEGQRMPSLARVQVPSEAGVAYIVGNLAELLQELLQAFRRVLALDDELRCHGLQLFLPDHL